MSVKLRPIVMVTVFCVCLTLSVGKAWTDDATMQQPSNGKANGKAASEKTVHEPAPNGITIPEGFRNWPVVSVTHRLDNNSMRAILGNDITLEAIKNGTTTPWPDGTTFVKVSWKAITHENWNTAIIPGEFIQLEVMTKDSRKYTSTGGWGFGRWRGMDLKPYGKDASFSQECFGCHTPMKNKDYVFTKPPVFPK